MLFLRYGFSFPLGCLIFLFLISPHQSSPPLLRSPLTVPCVWSLLSWRWSCQSSLVLLSGTERKGATRKEHGTWTAPSSGTKTWGKSANLTEEPVNSPWTCLISSGVHSSLPEGQGWFSPLTPPSIKFSASSSLKAKRDIGSLTSAFCWVLLGQEHLSHLLIIASELVLVRSFELSSHGETERIPSGISFTSPHIYWSPTAYQVLC